MSGSDQGTLTGMTSNNGFERAVQSLTKGAAGASDDFAPAAPGNGLTRPA